MTLLETRKKYGLSQVDASFILNVPIRTYIRYEINDSYGSELKRKEMIKALINECQITEEKGLLTIEKIANLLADLFNDKYPGQIVFCYLFGSYAKGYAKEDSDVDLCVSTTLTGLKFVGLSEAIHQVLNKKIDLIRFSNLKDNLTLIQEIMKDGIKIYG